MSREVDVVDAEGEGCSPSRKTRLRIFIETIIRAGMNAVPVVGAALEKASFGYKDALFSKQLLDLVRATEAELRKLKSTEQALSDDDITKITNSILESPDVARLADAIEAASIQTTAVLGEILLQIAHQRVMEESSARRAMQEYANLRREQQDINRTVQSAAVREEALLNTILAKLDQTAASSIRGPAELLRTLDSTRVRRMLRNASHIGAGARHSKARGEAFVGADFSEVYGYVNWPSNNQDLFLADAALFEIGPSPVYLLPGTLDELLYWVRRSGDHVLSSAGAIASGKVDKKDVLFHLSSPITRLQRLFRQGRVSACPSQEEADLFSAEKFHELVGVGARAVQAVAPKKKMGATIRDCQNLAFFCVALGAPWLANRAPVLVSRDESLPAAERALRGAGVLHTEAPLIAHPIEWSYDTLLRHRATAYPKSTVSGDWETIYGSMRKLRCILLDPSPDRVAGLAEIVPTLKDSLGRYRDYFAELSTWFIRDVHWESHIRTESARTEDWLLEMIRGHGEAMEALSDIEFHVEKMMGAYEPFLHT